MKFYVRPTRYCTFSFTIDLRYHLLCTKTGRLCVNIVGLKLTRKPS